MKNKNLGYGNAERLADIMALIQVLSLGEDTKRSENGLNADLQRKPLTAKSWSEFAGRHPEFFRVRVEGSGDPTAHRVSLVARTAMPKRSDNHRDPLPSDLIGKLLDMAINLHDREVARSERWKAWLPVAGAIIAGLFTVAAAIMADSPFVAPQSSSTHSVEEVVRE